MKALVFMGPRQLEVMQRPDAQPGPGEVLLQVVATGICGSDLHGYTGENGRRFAGQVIGHETVGRVVRTGDQTHGPDVGTLVTINPVISCGNCELCRNDLHSGARPAG